MVVAALSSVLRYPDKYSPNDSSYFSTYYENPRISGKTDSARSWGGRSEGGSWRAVERKRAKAFKELGGSLAVVKAQIHAGGRGKGNVKDNPAQRGVQLVRSAEEAAKVAGNLLGKPLVTIQTGPEGQVVKQVLVEEGCDIDRELYLGVVVDRLMAGPVLIASCAGGMNIEEVAEKTPELIFKEPFDPEAGLQPYQARKMAAMLGLKGNSIRSGGEVFAVAMPRVGLERWEFGRGQSAGGDEERRAGGARREDELRRQRIVPASGATGDARPVGRGANGSAGRRRPG